MISRDRLTCDCPTNGASVSVIFLKIESDTWAIADARKVSHG